MLKPKQTQKIIYYTVITLIFVLAFLVILSAMPLPGGLRFYTSKTDNLSPDLPNGSLFVVQPQDNYQVGDIITFLTTDSTSGNAIEVTQRIVGITSGGTNALITTKTDRNAAAALTSTQPVNVTGKLKLVIPLLGFPVAFAHTLLGLILLIILPSLVIIAIEIQSIIRESRHLISERRSRQLTAMEQVEVAVGQKLDKVEKAIISDVIQVEHTLEKVEQSLTREIAKEAKAMEAEVDNTPALVATKPTTVTPATKTAAKPRKPRATTTMAKRAPAKRPKTPMAKTKANQS